MRITVLKIATITCSILAIWKNISSRDICKPNSFKSVGILEANLATEMSAILAQNCLRPVCLLQMVSGHAIGGRKLFSTKIHQKRIWSNHKIILINSHLVNVTK